MVRATSYLGVLCTVFFIGACQALRAPQAPVPFSEALQARALALEARGDTTAAIGYWEAVSAVSAEKVTVLQALRQERMDTELMAAEKVLAEGEVAQGIAHLLKVLRLDPSHAEAKSRLQGTRSRGLVVPYTIYGGESAEIIAGRVYKNVWLAPLVEALYGPDRRKGEVLWLPRVDASLVAAQFSYTKAIARARRDYKAGAHEQLLAVSEEILSYAPDDSETLYLKNTAAHNLAESLFQEGAYLKALSMYRRVDPYFTNERPRIEEILAIRQLLREESRARKNTALLQEARLLEREGALVASRTVLMTVNSGFSGRIELERGLSKKMTLKAEEHYRVGVQLFLDEDLMAAIAEWEKSLELNPGHAKAGEGVENARRLLEKVNGIEPKTKRNKP